MLNEKEGSQGGSSGTRSTSLAITIFQLEIMVLFVRTAGTQITRSLRPHYETKRETGRPRFSRLAGIREDIVLGGIQAAWGEGRGQTAGEI